MTAILPIVVDLDENGSYVIRYAIPDDAPPMVREGLARRALVTSGHPCPCGAVFELPRAILPGEVVRIAVEHEPDCPAVEDHLRAAILEWKAGGAP